MVKSLDHSGCPLRIIKTQLLAESTYQAVLQEVTQWPHLFTSGTSALKQRLSLTEKPSFLDEFPVENGDL
jgi:hypothetical protein